jgi:hypothetical protein
MLSWDDETIDCCDVEDCVGVYSKLDPIVGSQSINCRHCAKCDNQVYLVQYSEQVDRLKEMEPKCKVAYSKKRFQIGYAKIRSVCGM